MSARVMVFATIVEGQQTAFEAAYAQVTAAVRGTPGHIRDELLRDVADPTRYTLISEWESEWAFRAWEDAPIHRELTTPMRPFWSGRVERHIYAFAAGLDAEVKAA